MPNEDLFMGLNRYTKYFLFLREAYTNAPIYFILFYFIFVVKAQGVKTLIMKNPIFYLFLLKKSSRVMSVL